MEYTGENRNERFKDYICPSCPALLCIPQVSFSEINTTAFSIMPLILGDLFCCIHILKQAAFYYKQFPSSSIP